MTDSKPLPPYGEFDADTATLLERVPEPLRGVLANMEGGPDGWPYQIEYVDKKTCLVSVYFEIGKPLTKKEFEEMQRAQIALGFLSGHGVRLGIVKPVKSSPPAG